VKLEDKHKDFNKIVYYGLSSDECIEKIATYCKECDKKLVAIVAEENEYSQPLKNAQDILLDDIWIYEVAMGLRVVLKSRADKYCGSNPDAIIVNEEYELLKTIGIDKDPNIKYKDDILVCYVETDQHTNKEKKFLKSCNLLGISPKAFGKGKPWNGAIDKFIYFNEEIRLLDIKEKYILFVDSRDVLMYKDLNEIKTKFEKYYPDCNLLFNGETNCYPNPSLKDNYPNQDKKYKYLNAGMCIGRTDFILEFFSKISKYFVDYEKNWSEQGVWTDIFFKYQDECGDDNPIKIDYDCHIFQCLWDEEAGRSANFDIVYNKNKIYNRLTGTEPCVFHSPGPTCSDSQVWKIINRTYHTSYKTKRFIETA